jgi:hypothetical protein
MFVRGPTQMRRMQADGGGKTLCATPRPPSGLGGQNPEPTKTAAPSRGRGRHSHSEERETNAQFRSAGDGCGRRTRSIRRAYHSVPLIFRLVGPHGGQSGSHTGTHRVTFFV